MHILKKKNKTPTKTEPTNRSKGQSFLALWDRQGTLTRSNLQGQNLLISTALLPQSIKAIEKNTLNCILI